MATTTTNDLEDILSQINKVEEEEVKDKTSSFQQDPRILQLKKHVKYVGRMIPYYSNPKNTFLSFEEVGFNSKLTGKYIYGGRSPSDAKLKDDLFRKAQWEAYDKVRNGTDEEKKETYALMPQRKQAVNFYLTEVKGDDDEAKARIGTVVALIYPAKLNFKDKKHPVPSSLLYKLIDDALRGEKQAKIGNRALDLSPEGRNLVINIGEKAGFKDYTGSEFDDKEDLKLTKTRIREIYDSAYDLSEFIPSVKSVEEIQKILDEHWYCKSANVEDEIEEGMKNNIDDDDDLPGLGRSSKETDEFDLDELTKD